MPCSVRTRVSLYSIGYGNMYPQCQVSHAFVGVESLVSILMTSVFTGMVYSKFSKATPRILFSGASSPVLCGCFAWLHV